MTGEQTTMINRQSLVGTEIITIKNYDYIIIFYIFYIVFHFLI